MDKKKKTKPVSKIFFGVCKLTELFANDMN